MDEFIKQYNKPDEDVNLSIYDLYIFNHLCNLEKLPNGCIISNNGLAEKLKNKISLMSIKRSLKNLEKFGYIFLEHIKINNKPRRRITTIYNKNNKNNKDLLGSHRTQGGGLSQNLNKDIYNQLAKNAINQANFITDKIAINTIKNKDNKPNKRELKKNIIKNIKDYLTIYNIKNDILEIKNKIDYFEKYKQTTFENVTLYLQTRESEHQAKRIFEEFYNNNAPNYTNNLINYAINENKQDIMINYYNQYYNQKKMKQISDIILSIYDKTTTAPDKTNN